MNRSHGPLFPVVFFKMIFSPFGDMLTYQAETIIKLILRWIKGIPRASGSLIRCLSATSESMLPYASVCGHISS